MKIWEYISNKLNHGQKIYVLTVIENFGSSPGRKGFKMLIAQDGFIYGSIGGGIMEFALVEEAQSLLIQDNPPTFIKKQIHKGQIENGSGMICSGEQTVAFHCLNSDHLSVINDLIDCIGQDGKGTLSLTPKSFYFSHKFKNSQFECEIKSNEDWYFEVSINFKETFYIIGGGHVSVPVTELLVQLGFYVIVIDNRSELNTLVNNNFAHKKLVIDYNNILDYISLQKNNYVAIMTNKYTDDKLVLSKLIKNNYKFIGVLGSKAKLKTMWKELIKEGFTRAELDTISAPIGLQIKSETPREIAVSIAAQIIQIKNKEKK